MKRLADAGDEMVRPDRFTYSTVINAWAKYGHAERAEAVLNGMLEDYAKGNQAAKPDLQCFNSVLRAQGLRCSQPTPRLVLPLHK